VFGNAVQTAFPKNSKTNWLKINFLCVLDHIDMLISKIISKNKKNIILMDFSMKNTLKSNRNHTPKQAASLNKDLRTSKPICMHMLITNTSIHCLDHEKCKSNHGS
jgi:hypothetical protein